jgi:hypothetical protein
MGLFDNLYNLPAPGEFSLGNKLPSPTVIGTSATGNPLQALIASLLAPPTQATKPAMDFGSLINALKKVPHLGIGGREITPENPMGDPLNPWNNPAFFAK